MNCQLNENKITTFRRPQNIQCGMSKEVVCARGTWAWCSVDMLIISLRLTDNLSSTEANSYMVMCHLFVIVAGITICI
jgi:hypothetical protein